MRSKRQEWRSQDTALRRKLAHESGSVRAEFIIGLGIERAPPEETFVPNVNDSPVPASTAAGTAATEGVDGSEETATI